MTTQEVISIQTKNFQINVKAFWINPEVEYQMNSGYLIDYLSGDKKFNSECLDSDHVYRELEAYGLDSGLINFIVNQL